jgi:hypothetical protein
MSVEKPSPQQSWNILNDEARGQHVAYVPCSSRILIPEEPREYERKKIWTPHAGYSILFRGASNTDRNTFEELRMWKNMH